MKGKTHVITLLASLALGLIAACGGGGGGTNAAPAAEGTISGGAVKGPVAGGTITAYAVNTNGTIGSPLGAAQTDAEGRYSMPLGEYSGPVYMEVTGGTYIDEATGALMPLLPETPLAAVLPHMETGAVINGVWVTPFTSMAGAMAGNMAGGFSEDNIAAANAAVGRYFVVDDILRTRPIDPLVANSGSTATQHETNYGMGLAAVSMYSYMQGFANSSAMADFLAEDASDGWMDGRMWDGNAISMGGMTGGGMMGGGMMMSPDAGTYGLYEAMHAFINSPDNLSGITEEDMYGVLEQLRTSNGFIN